MANPVSSASSATEVPLAPTQPSIETAVAAPKLNPYSWRVRSPNARLVYIRDSETADEELSRLSPGPLGFDMEWKPTFFAKKKENPVALIQLATSDAILLIQVSAMQRFPPKLQDILQDAGIVKTGVGIQGDCKKLWTDYAVITRNCVDLAMLARSVDNARWKGRYTEAISLARLCAAYEELELRKGTISRSNWEANLTGAQQEYAANDSHIGFLLYQRFIQMAAAMPSPPLDIYYSFNFVKGFATDLRTDVPWNPRNPDYDPGPPPPPPPPKEKKDGDKQGASSKEKKLRGSHMQFPRAADVVVSGPSTVSQMESTSIPQPDPFPFAQPDSTPIVPQPDTNAQRMHMESPNGRQKKRQRKQNVDEPRASNVVVSGPSTISQVVSTSITQPNPTPIVPQPDTNAQQMHMESPNGRKKKRQRKQNVDEPHASNVVITGPSTTQQNGPAQITQPDPLPITRPDSMPIVPQLDTNTRRMHMESPNGRKKKRQRKQNVDEPHASNVVITGPSTTQLDPLPITQPDSTPIVPQPDTNARRTHTESVNGRQKKRRRKQNVDEPRASNVVITGPSTMQQNGPAQKGKGREVATQISELPNGGTTANSSGARSLATPEATPTRRRTHARAFAARPAPASGATRFTGPPSSVRTPQSQNAAVTGAHT
ncbi:hypothetical protein WOLCODRAFT_147401 [Wolfiporia cocos MD-104 SS10]|uniref:3'-5' exonuclease n=1 Tax=Wolfiporia cocos (strain MD-104) TaxID=742152 RepID=A0A2H3IUB0_WOLCO|nr:hypothetical protein WOLCODRAFT_147401 [Wolfiporia cocos MD-104 SS10]